MEATEAGLDVPAEPSTEPLATAMNRWVESRTSLAPNTRDAYKRVVNLVIGDRIGSMPIGKVTKGDLHGLYSRWFDRYAVASVKQYAAVVAGCIAEAHAEGSIRTNPAYRALEIPKDIEPAPAKQKAWTGNQVRQFIDRAANDELYPLWRLLLSTGMRRSEALALEHSDIDLNERSAQIRGSLVSVKRSGEVHVGRPKNGKTRTAYFDEATAGILGTHLREQRKRRLQSAAWHDGYDFAFTRGAGLPWNPPTVSMRFKALDRQARPSTDRCSWSAAQRRHAAHREWGRPGGRQGSRWARIDRNDGRQLLAPLRHWPTQYRRRSWKDRQQ